MDFNSKFRLRRFAHFRKLARKVPADELRILDLGGEEAYWQDKIALLKRRVSITLVNVRRFPVSIPGIESIEGDARDLRQFADNSFDIVHSNSVIEHVGRWQNMQAMANEARRLAPFYFIQTPYFWFPMEPHFRTVGFHWLPETVRAKLLLKTQLGFVDRAKTFDAAMQAVQNSYLLDRRMMTELFPDADILFERWYGLPKSIMAIRAPH